MRITAQKLVGKNQFFMKKCILVKLDIFSKIGLGHFSRINNLVNADLNTNYFLIYRSDIDVSQLIGNSNFKQSFNITKKDSEKMVDLKL